MTSSVRFAFSSSAAGRRRLAALASTAACALACQGALAARQAGETAPAFTAQASLAGKPFGYALQDALRQGPVVVYFYPSAFTGGCSLQAHAFAVNLDKFAAAGATIIGVSLDSIERLNAFSADPESCAGKVPVASDADGRIAKAYGIAVREAPVGRQDSRGAEIDHGLAERTTFVVAPDGHIHATLGDLAPLDNVEQALSAVQQLAGQRAAKR